MRTAKPVLPTMQALMQRGLPLLQFTALTLALAAPQNPTPSATAPAAAVHDVHLYDADRVEREAIEYVKSFPASAIDPLLPKQPFEQWLQSVVGTSLRWERNDCGEGSSREVGDVLACVEVDGGADAMVIMMAIGENGHEPQAPPELFFGTMKLFDVDRDISRLSDLPGLVKQADERRIRFAGHPLHT